MFRESLVRIKAQCTTIEKSGPALVKKLGTLSPDSGENLDSATIVPNTIGTIDDVLSRMLVAVGYAKQLTATKPEAFLLISKASIVAVEKHLDVFSSVIGAIDGVLIELETWGLSRIDLPNIQLIRRDNNTEAINLSDKLGQIDGASDNLLHATHQILSVVGSKKLEPFIGVASTFRELIKDLQASKQDLANIRRAAKTSGTQAENTIATINQNVEEINNKLIVATENSDAIVAQKNVADGVISEINAIQTQALTLKGTVTQFQVDFEDFDRRLSDRLATFDKGEEALELLVVEKSKELIDLTSQTKVLKQELEKIEKDSKHVLGNATAAGLSSKFRSAGRRLRWPLIASHIIFYISIIAIFGSILVVFDAIPSLRGIVQLPSLSPPTGTATADAILFVFGSVLTRFVFLLPGLLLAGFAARWHRALQRLSEEYMHKESVAASVPGFKEESGKAFEEAIAAAAFENMLKNPAATFQSPHPTDKRDGWLSRFIKKPIREIIQEAMEIKDRTP